MQYDTIGTCQDKINKMDTLLKLLKETSQIQFPIEENETRQFPHYTVNQIQDTLQILEREIDKLQSDLNDYETRMNIINASDEDLESTLDDIDRDLCDMHISAAKCDILYRHKERIINEIERRKKAKEDKQ